MELSSECPLLPRQLLSAPTGSFLGWGSPPFLPDRCYYACPSSTKEWLGDIDDHLLTVFGVAGGRNATAAIYNSLD